MNEPRTLLIASCGCGCPRCGQAIAHLQAELEKTAHRSATDGQTIADLRTQIVKRDEAIRALQTQAHQEREIARTIADQRVRHEQRYAADRLRYIESLPDELQKFAHSKDGVFPNPTGCWIHVDNLREALKS